MHRYNNYNAIKYRVKVHSFDYDAKVKKKTNNTHMNIKITLILDSFFKNEKEIISIYTHTYI